MSRWFRVEAVDESFFSAAPYVYRYPVELDVPPERVWESLVSDESLAAWGLGVQKLVWTSPRPFGIGTRREVTLPLHAITVRENFFIWDEGKRYAFFVDEANRPLLKHFAEDYVVEPTERGSRFTWTIALAPQPWARPLLWAGSPLNRWMFGQLAVGARKYFASHR